jgi:hypothetical protein
MPDYEYQFATDSYGVSHVTAVGDATPLCGIDPDENFTAWTDPMSADDAFGSLVVVGFDADVCIHCLGQLRGMDPEVEDVMCFEEPNA